MRRLNEFRLTPKGRTASFLALGDIHVGSATCNEKKALGYLEYALENNIPILGMGDYCENSTRSSIGSGIYDQVLSPMKQIAWLEEHFEPLVRRKLIIGLHDGNHEQRTYIACGINVVQLVCSKLKIPYLGEACFQVFRVGNQSYKVYSVHGRSGARLPQTKMLSCMRLASIATADLYLHAHVHELATTACEYFDFRNGVKVRNTRHFVLTGHFLEYEHSYAEMMTMMPSRTGCPNIRLHADSHDIHVSL